MRYTEVRENPVDAMVPIASKSKEHSFSDAIGTIASTREDGSASTSAGRSYWLLTALVLVAYVAIQSVALTAPWFPADDAQELAFVRGMESPWRLLGVDAFGLFRPVKNLLFFAFSALEPLGMPAVRTLAIVLGLATFFPVLAFSRRVFGDRRLSLHCGVRFYSVEKDAICGRGVSPRQDKRRELLIFQTRRDAASTTFQPDQQDKIAPLLCAAIWLLSPTLVSSVVWLSCVNIQLMCGFAAAAFVCHDRNRPVLAAILLLLACVSYECAVAVGPCLVVFDFFLRPERFRTRRAWLVYGLYALVTLVFLIVRHYVGSTHTVNGNFANCSRLDIILASAYLTGQHFLSWLWPFGRMTVFGGYAAGSVPAAVLVMSWAALVGCAILALALRRRMPVIGFGLAVALVGFLPVSNVTGIGNGPYGDYYLGLASFGLAAAACALFRERIGRLVMPLLRGVAVVAAFQWAWLWADGDRAYFAAAENFPDFFGNKIILVKRLSEAEMWKESLQLGEEVEAAVGPDSGQMSEVYVVRGLYELRIRKDADAALRAFERSRKSDDFGGAGRNRDFYVGCVYEDLLNDPNRAEKCYASSLRGRWTIDNIQAADRYARLLAVRGEWKDAIAVWERALKIAPGNKSIRHNLNLALLSSKGGR